MKKWKEATGRKAVEGKREEGGKKKINKKKRNWIVEKELNPGAAKSVGIESEREITGRSRIWFVVEKP